MCFSSQITVGTPSARNPANASSGCSSTSGRFDVAVGDIAGGRWISQRGSMANRLMTSSAAAAFSSRTVTVRASRRLDDPLAGDVLDVEQEGGPLLSARAGGTA